jgi:hypothetical protein
VRHATTRCASTQPKALVTPRVAVDVSLASSDLDFAWFVVTPQPTVAATDRAVATRKSTRLSRDLDSDCTAVARPREHGASLLCGLTDPVQLQTTPELLSCVKLLDGRREAG